jgi:hypothetical protein
MELLFPITVNIPKETAIKPVIIKKINARKTK